MQSSRPPSPSSPPSRRPPLSLLVACLAASAVSARAQVELNFLEAGRTREAEVVATLRTELDLAEGGVVHYGLSADRLNDIMKSLSVMYKALPKTAEGKLSHQVVRYALHRYFLRSHGWFVRGLEPRNDTWHGSPDPAAHNSTSMREWVPSYLQDVLEMSIGQSSVELVELAVMAAALQDLIEMESDERLGVAYEMYGLSRMAQLTRADTESLVRTYYIAFLNSWDFTAGNQAEAEQNVEEFIQDYEGWPEAQRWLGDLSAVALRPEIDGTFLFEGVAPLVRRVGQHYYELNDGECDDLKETLRGMQGNKPGRVRLSAFYHKGMYSHWAFSEKKSLLRKIGALDESDPRHPSVIIANYAMAKPNCLEASNLYAICCRNQCEDLLDSIERKVELATAAPEALALLVSGLGSVTIKAPRQLPQQLLDRLSQIASHHGGQVPLHGRLFAQWMHHAYPLECPYPHELGSVNPLSRNEWMKKDSFVPGSGEASGKASLKEMAEHISRDACHVDAYGGVHCVEDDSPEIPWNSREELLTASPRGGVQGVMFLFFCFIGAGLMIMCVLAVIFLSQASRRRILQPRDPLE